MGVTHALKTIAHRGGLHKVKNIRMVGKTWAIQTSSGPINSALKTKRHRQQAGAHRPRDTWFSQTARDPVTTAR